MSGLPSSAEVVVVGGCVIGVSTAFHLAEAGVRDVVLIERDSLASGSTSRAAGGVRAQFSDELNIAIALRTGVSRFLYATGFSGHGFLQGPAVGEIVRDLVLGRPPLVDVAPLGVERFAGTRMRPEYNVI